MKTPFLLTALLALNGILFAQSPHRCATDSLWKSDSSHLQKQAVFASELAQFRTQPPTSHQYWPYQSGGSTQAIIPGCKKSVYIIPVVVHIDTSNAVINVTDTQVYQQMTILNQRFEDYGIRFSLARVKPNGSSFNGINRFGGSFDYKFDKLAAAYANSASHYFNPDRYLNIYATPQILATDGSPSPIAGFNSVFADMRQGKPDMIVMLYNKFGDYTTCINCGLLDAASRGLTLVHEVGHYLGLRELWQGGCNTGNTALTCATEGDLCCDTRPVNANYSCPPPAGNDCSYHLTLADNHENYMDYSGEDCQDNFTPDQISLMQATLELYRNKLISPQNLNLVALDDCFTSAWFDTPNNFSCDSGTFIFYAIGYSSAVNYRWEIKTSGITVLNQSTSADTLLWKTTQNGQYDVTLTIRFNSNDSTSVTRPNYIQIGDCGTVLASEQGNWYFGDHAGIKFTTSGAFRDLEIIRFKPNNLNTAEGTVSRSDSSGNLLFYAGGSLRNPGFMDVYNKNYQPMPNSPIIGDFSSSQAGTVVQVPGEHSKYYLFTVAGADATNNKGFRYSIIDMTLDGGNGDILTSFKNIPVKQGPVGADYSNLDSAILCGEQIAVIPKCFPGEYWILITSGYHNLPTNGIFILVYELNQSGIKYHGKTTFVVDPRFNVASPFGFLKTSTDGNWLYLWGNVFQFDKSNGTIALYKSILPTGQSLAASFSPNSKLLYIMSPINTNTCNLFQFDLESSDDSLDKKFIAVYPFADGYISMQNGPDQRIYISKNGSSSLAHIQHPNQKVSSTFPNACAYSYNGPVLSQQGVGGLSALGLPNMIDAKAAASVPLDFLAVNEWCGTVTFIPNTPCANTYLWYFGDGDSSTLEKPVHVYTDTGTYLVTLVVNGVQTKQKQILNGINSRISGNQITCVPRPALTGYSIQQFNPSLQYNWSVFNGSISAIDPNQNCNIYWNGPGYVSLHVKNPLNGCEYFDTLHVSPVIFTVNQISSIYNGGCFPGSDLDLTGDSVSSTSGLINYQWQYKPQGSTWADITANGAQKDYSGKLFEANTFYRRRAFDGQCESFSDSMEVTADIIITQQPENVSTCAGDQTSSFTFNVGTIHNTSQQYKAYLMAEKYVWPLGYFYEPVDSIVGLSGVNPSASLSSPAAFRYNYYIKISTDCGYYHSDTAKRIDCNFRVWTTNYQDSLVVAEDSNIELAAIFTQCIGGPELPPVATVWQSSSNGVNWVDLIGEVNDTLRLIASSCNNGRYYRRQMNILCSYADMYSPVFKLLVTRNNFANLMMQDYSDDNGTEPNLTTDWRNLYEPPSLFIRYNQDGQTAHQIPNLAEHSGVYVYYNIKNIGTDTSKAADLYLYWTSGGPHGADWPIAWHDMTGNRFTVINPNSLQLGSQLSWGDKINQTPISIPSIAPGDSLFDAYFWNTLPNPLDFHSIFNGDTTYPNERALCLLARVETCSNDSFGMSFKETRATRKNIINNRKIVGRNSWVQFIDQGPKRVEFPLTVRSYDGVDLPLRLLMTHVDSCAFQSIGFVTAELSDGLWQQWEAGGFEGSGFSFDVDHTLVIDNLSDFQLNNIQLASENTEQIKLSFESTAWPDEPMFCRYAIGQFHGETTEPEGSFVIAVEVSIQDQSSSASFYIPTEKVVEDSLKSINAMILSDENSETTNRFALAALDQLAIFPNPAHKQINFAFDIQQELPTEILLTNALGASVAMVYKGNLKSGHTLIPWQNQGLIPGLYIAQVKIGSQNRNFKIIITTEY